MPYHLHSDPNADDGHWRDEGLRECARGDRCTDPRILLTVNGRPQRHPALTPRAFCDTDATTIGRALTDFPTKWVYIWHNLGSKGQTNGPKVDISKTAPVPLSLAADELLRDIVTILTSWEERVARVARLHLDTEASRRRRAHVAVPAAARMLAAHVNVLLALPAEPMMRAVSLKAAAALPPGTRGLVHEGAEYADVIMELSGADAGLEVLQLHHRCRRMLGETPPVERRLHGVACVCGFAELRELVDDDGTMNGARCWECGNEYTAATYAELVDGQAQDVKTAGYRRKGIWSQAGDDLETRRA